MKVLINQFLGLSHSWSFVGQGIARSLVDKQYDVDLFSTNGIKNIPNDLKKHIIGYAEGKHITGNLPSQSYDIAISFTAMQNFQQNLKYGHKKIAIWASEMAGKNALPNGFAKQHNYCDYLLPPSSFSKQIFADSGIPNEKMVVVPHGLNNNWFNGQDKFKLKTDKKIKILNVFGQPHLRKGIPDMLETYGRAFTKKDNVCLVIKAVDKKPQHSFEVSFTSIFEQFKKKFPEHAEIIVLKEFIDDMSPVFRACDIHFSMTKAECFFFPALEALATGLINVIPNYGGHKDFCNEENSLMVDGQVGFAPATALYWQQKNGTLWFNPSIDDAVNKLQYAVKNIDCLKNQFSCKERIAKNYSWNKITTEIMELCK